MKTGFEVCNNQFWSRKKRSWEILREVQFHEMKDKLSTATTLLNHASNLPSTPEGKAKELFHVTDALNSYLQSVISNIQKKKPPPAITTSPEELVGMFFGCMGWPFWLTPWLRSFTLHQRPNWTSFKTSKKQWNPNYKHTPYDITTRVCFSEIKTTRRSTNKCCL